MQDEFLRLQQMLNKTIVFITHDFDEALRLADRIAIMKDGAIEQCDTPDQIVLQPGHGICAQVHRRYRQGTGRACSTSWPAQRHRTKVSRSRRQRPSSDWPACW